MKNQNRKDPREVAYQICYQVIFQDKRLDECMDETIRKFESSASEKFIRRLTKGIIERKETMDGILRMKSKVKPEKMDKPIRALLYLGIYQLLFMEVEDYAAVNETVKMTVNHGFSHLRNFVNAVLRSVEREKETLFSELSFREKLGVSEELFSFLKMDYGEEKTVSILSAFLKEDRSRLYVRRNLSKISEAEWMKKLQEEGNSAIAVSENPGEIPIYEFLPKTPLSESKSFRDGDFYIQSGSSVSAVEMIKDLLVNGESRLNILDMCASPGGKSLCMADLLEYEAEKNHRKIHYRIQAADVSEKKVRLISENVSKYGFMPTKERESGIDPLVSDGTKYREEWKESYDLVWVDAPCSGLGDLAGKPDLKLRFSEAQVKSLTELQEKLLNNACLYVKKGGALVYSTCTLTLAENENQITEFLKNHPEFQKDSEKTYFPDRGRWDGFYFARLKRKR